MANSENLKAKQQKTGPEAEPEIGRVRELLFGEDLRDIERRISDVQQDLQRTLESSLKNTIARVEALESFMRKELESLGERLKGERSERRADSNQLSVALERLQTEEDQTRLDLMAQTKNLSDEAHSDLRALSQKLSKALTELDSAKLDRARLARLLKEISEELSKGPAEGRPKAA